MTLPVAVIDTNVIVSGLIGGERASPTAVILDAMLGGRFTYLFSLDLLADYREVLLRSAIRRRHGLSDAEVEVVLTEIALVGTARGRRACRFPFSRLDSRRPPVQSLGRIRVLPI